MSDMNVSYLDQSDAVKARFDKLKQREVILEVKGLGKTYDSHQGPVTALQDINFKTHRREFVCVIGPSGCGKSTLIRILAGLESHSSGDVLLDGKPLPELTVAVVPGGVRHRGVLREQAVKTDAKGEFSVKWLDAGMYAISASYPPRAAQPPAGAAPAAPPTQPAVRYTYTGTVEVLPE